MRRKRKDKLEPCDPEAYYDILDDLLEDERVCRMKDYVQHGSITTYDHCRNVAMISQKINRRLHIKADEETMLRGAILHDYYLYDWHDNHRDENGWHGFSHAEVAMRNAKEDFDIDQPTGHVIRCHMWPLNITHIPRSRAAWVVCAADKFVSGLETILERK